MSIISVSEMKDSLSKILNRVAYGQERVIVASRGTPKAAVISVQDLELLEELEDTMRAHEALAEYEQGETVSLEELIAELEAGSGGVSD